MEYWVEEYEQSATTKKTHNTSEKNATGIPYGQLVVEMVFWIRFDQIDVT